MEEKDNRISGLLSATGNNIFVTGKPGTGKTTLVKDYIDQAEENVCVVAPTGIAALNVGGQTIHSFFKFTLGLLDEDYISLGGNFDVMRNMDVLVIDEISMVRADVLSAIDRSLRAYRDRPDDPFGGVRVIAVGDAFQLPPVVREREEIAYFSSVYRSPYFFDAPVWREFPPTCLELTHVYRQTEIAFLSILDSIRVGSLSAEQLQFFNSACFRLADIPDDMLMVCSTNATASEWNNRHLESLPGPFWHYDAMIDGVFPESSYPAPETIELKKDARVMLVKNDSSDKKWVNGSCGTVLGTEEEYVVVMLDNGKLVEVYPETWEIIKYAQRDPVTKKLAKKTVGSFTQLPLRLGWAITIHKSQGQTFERIGIDLGRGAFAFGQTYVAISRCRSLAGLQLRFPLQPSDIKVDPRVVAFQRAISARGEA